MHPFVQGRGLGRLFLRHLRRTNAILHVLDAAAGWCFGSLSWSLPELTRLDIFPFKHLHANTPPAD